MSRNLCADHCVKCGHGPVTIADLSGKPIEFRGYSKYVPVIGARWDCPSCGVAYFAAYRTRGNCVGCQIAHVYPPDFPGTWEIDLSYWQTYNDECYGDDALKGLDGPPWHLVTEGREDQRFGQGPFDTEGEL
jgi:hypothetical protein